MDEVATCEKDIVVAVEGDIGCEKGIVVGVEGVMWEGLPIWLETWRVDEL